MVGTSEMLSAFESTSGISPNQISLLVRSLLCAIFFLWAAWTVYGKFQLIQSKVLDIHDIPLNILRILLLCALVVLLVFVA